MTCLFSFHGYKLLKSFQVVEGIRFVKSGCLRLVRALFEIDRSSSIFLRTRSTSASTPRAVSLLNLFNTIVLDWLKITFFYNLR